MGNLACKQAFLFAQGMQAAKLDLSGDLGHLVSLFSSRSIHEFCFLVNVYLQSHVQTFFSSIHTGNYPRMILIFYAVNGAMVNNFVRLSIIFLPRVVLLRVATLHIACMAGVLRGGKGESRARKAQEDRGTFSFLC